MATTNPRAKIVVNPFKNIPKEPENFLENTWTKLRKGLEVVFDLVHEQVSKEALYQSAKELCIHDHQQVLYDRLEGQLDSFILSQVSELQRADRYVNSFSGKILDVWNRYLVKIMDVRQIFFYLERNFMMNQRNNAKFIYDLGLKLWQTHVHSQPELISAIVTVLLSLIQEERLKEMDYSHELQKLVSMCSELNIYKLEFEPRFLRESEAFYKAESSHCVNEMTVGDYIMHAEKRLVQEESRSLSYLQNSTRKPSIQTVENLLLIANSQTLIEKGFKDLLDQNRVTELRKMYELFLRVNKVDELKTALEAYTITKGAMMLTETDTENLVDSLLQFKAKMDTVQADAFMNNYNLKYTAQRAWERFLNQDPNKPAELIAKYIDERMKKSSKHSLNETEIEALIDRLIGVFRMVQAKDVFEAFFCKRLAKRLLLETSVSFDGEKAVVVKLKGECGAQFTSRISGMLKDIQLSKDTMENFREVNGPCSIDFHVFLLTGPMWPAQTQVTVKLQDELQLLQDKYQELYIRKNKGKKLKWNSSASNCVLRTFIGGTRRELSVSLHQAIVLTLFNTADSLTFPDLVSLTGLPEEETKKELAALSCMRYKILLKSTPDKSIRRDDVFRVNQAFSSRHVRIAINSVQMKETVRTM